MGLRRTAGLLAALLLGLLAATPAAAQELQQLQLREKNGEVTLELRLSKAPEPKIFQLQNPDRLVIDLPGIRPTEKLQQLQAAVPEAADNWLRGVRLGQHKGFLRLVVDSHHPLNHQLKHSKRNIRIRIRPIGAKTQTAQTADGTPGRDIVVVIDPGHGGRDPGAVNRRGQQEKDIVLQIGHRIHQLIEPLRGFSAHLTRSKDVYLPLAARRKRAQELQADIFLSLHADSVNRKSPSGASVYVLSLKGASSVAARRLAERENTEVADATQIGGIALIGDDDFDSTIVDLAQTATLERSARIAESMLASIAKVSRLHAGEPGRANFVVLRAPYIPSILVETGFMSNDKDATRLANARFQRRLAHSILTGLYAYLHTNPHADKALHGETRLAYEVQSGDTLGDIALRYGMTSHSLMKTNKLAGVVIHPGQLLVMPIPSI